MGATKPLNNPNQVIRAAVVDDSPTARELIMALLSNSKGIVVVGSGATGEDAVRLVRRMKPDVLCMDVRMPIMDGLEATRHIMRESPLPIILVTSSMMAEDVDLTFRALKAGALTVVKKPGLADPETCDNLLNTVRLMAGLPVVHHWGREPQRPTPPSTASVKTAAQSGDLTELTRTLEIIGIASSTGGPGTLATILSPLPADFPWPLLIVQHVSPGFGQGLAEWLNTQTPLTVGLAGHGDVPQPGMVLLAPDDYHLQVNRSKVVELYKGEPYRGLRPSANFLFNTLASVYREAAMGIILTGMGNDGVDGMEAMQRAGGLTIAQDEESCVVYGMPREAALRGAASRVLPPEGIAALLLGLAQRKKSAGSLRSEPKGGTG